MKQVRYGVFETNSSSTHSITVYPIYDKDAKLPEKLEVCELYEGRDFEYRTIEEKFTVLVVLAYHLGDLYHLVKRLYDLGVKEMVLSKVKGDSLWMGGGIECTSLGEIDCEKDYYDEIMESDDSLRGWLLSPFSELSGHDNNDDWE